MRDLKRSCLAAAALTAALDLRHARTWARRADGRGGGSKGLLAHSLWNTARTGCRPARPSLALVSSWTTQEEWGSPHLP